MLPEKYIELETKNLCYTNLESQDNNELTPQVKFDLRMTILNADFICNIIYFLATISFIICLITIIIYSIR